MHVLFFQVRINVNFSWKCFEELYMALRPPLQESNNSGAHAIQLEWESGHSKHWQYFLINRHIVIDFPRYIRKHRV